MYLAWLGVAVVLMCVCGCASNPGGRPGPAIPADPPLAEPVYSPQALNVAKPGALEFWVKSPVRHQGYPWNIIRMWFPEAAGIDGPDGRELWRFHMSQDPAHWEYTSTGLRAECDIPHGGKFTRTVVREGSTLHLAMTFRNDSGAAWRNVNAGSCLQLSAAPDYADNTGERTYWVLNDVLTPTGQLAITDAGMRGSRDLDQPVQMKDGSVKTISEGAVFVASKEGRYVLGYSWQPARGLFYNRAGIVACNHVQPDNLDIPAGQTRTLHGIVFIHEGPLDQAYQRYLAWKASPAANDN